MMDKKYAFVYTAPEEHIKREKARARQLRQSAWWKRKRARGVCYYCGRKVGPDQLTMDHIVPLSRGGRSVKANIVACCKDCNTKKKYLLPMEWQQYLNSLRDSTRE